MILDVLPIPLLVAQQEGDAVVGPGHYQPAPPCHDSLGSATAEPINQHDCLDVAGLLNIVDPSLEFPAQLVGLVMQPLWQNVDTADSGIDATKVLNLSFQNSARDDRAGGRHDVTNHEFRLTSSFGLSVM